MTVVVGTAGHIDHGKTTLLRALTGIDADRLPEERARGMTIDVGYAHLVLPDGSELDFVDVPGHDRLVGNMLVGAGEIDAALLVVAADDGPRAQTLEHLGLLDALGIGVGVVVVTKIDVGEDRTAPRSSRPPGASSRDVPPRRADRGGVGRRAATASTGCGRRSRGSPIGRRGRGSRPAADDRVPAPDRSRVHGPRPRHRRHGHAPRRPDRPRRDPPARAGRTGPSAFARSRSTAGGRCRRAGAGRAECRRRRSRRARAGRGPDRRPGGRRRAIGSSSDSGAAAPRPDAGDGPSRDGAGDGVVGRSGRDGLDLPSGEGRRSSASTAPVAVAPGDRFVLRRRRRRRDRRRPSCSTRAAPRRLAPPPTAERVERLAAAVASGDPGVGPPGSTCTASAARRAPRAGIDRWRPVAAAAVGRSRSPRWSRRSGCRGSRRHARRSARATTGAAARVHASGSSVARPARRPRPAGRDGDACPSTRVGHRRPRRPALARRDGPSGGALATAAPPSLADARPGGRLPARGDPPARAGGPDRRPRPRPRLGRRDVARPREPGPRAGRDASPSRRPPSATRPAPAAST